jgi:hypothetical protein
MSAISRSLRDACARQLGIADPDENEEDRVTGRSSFPQEVQLRPLRIREHGFSAKREPPIQHQSAQLFGLLKGKPIDRPGSWGKRLPTELERPLIGVQKGEIERPKIVPIERGLAGAV